MIKQVLWNWDKEITKEYTKLHINDKSIINGFDKQYEHVINILELNCKIKR
jgi:hypothetical protein